mgnify:CR=1 FL=1
MGFLGSLFHLSGFVAPALALGLLLPLAARFLLPQRNIVTGFWVQVAIGTVAGVAVLLAGLWLFGRDGKMATYASLVLVTASVQWLMAGAWRR